MLPYERNFLNQLSQLIFLSDNSVIWILFSSFEIFKKIIMISHLDKFPYYIDFNSACLLVAHKEVRRSLAPQKSVPYTISFIKDFWLKWTWKLWALSYHFWLRLNPLKPIFWLWLSHHVILQLLTHLQLTILNCYLTLSTVNSLQHNHHGHILDSFPNCQLPHH